MSFVKVGSAVAAVCPAAAVATRVRPAARRTIPLQPSTSHARTYRLSSSGYSSPSNTTRHPSKQVRRVYKTDAVALPMLAPNEIGGS